MDYITIGIDVSKASFDVCLLPTREFRKFPNEAKGYKSFYKYISNLNVDKIIMENTGCYHRNLAVYLVDKLLEVYVLNPRQIRKFAQAAGYLAKTDKIDAFVIADFGVRMQLPDKQTNTKEHVELRELIARRRQIVSIISSEKNRLEKTSGNLCIKQIKASIAFHDKQVKEIEDNIKLFIKCHESYKKLYDKLIEVKGMGEVTTTVFLSEMPELGYIDRRKIAALVGVAPMNCDSGNMKGQRHIRFGRLYVRNSLYMATLSAVRANPIIKEYYLRLINHGKPFKVAITACMHKLLLHLNSIAQHA
jgi:transposase